jgi:hypothetical protein
MALPTAGGLRSEGSRLADGSTVESTVDQISKPHSGHLPSADNPRRS